MRDRGQSSPDAHTRRAPVNSSPGAVEPSPPNRTSLPVEIWTGASDPPLTPAHRAYLRAFDNYLLDHGPREAMALALKRVLADAGIEALERAA